MTSTVDLPKISADAHVDEPHDLWYERLDVNLREFAPRRIHANADGGWSLVINGNPIGWSELSAEEAAAAEAERVAAASPDVRLNMMKTDRINGEIVYPTIGLYAWDIDNPMAGQAVCRVYNDWIRQQIGGHDRIKLAAMIPTWDADMAIAEVERMAGDPSVGGLLLPLVGKPEWNSREWEPMWAAIAGTGKPAVMHQGSGHDMIFYRGWGSGTANLLATQSMAPRAAALLSCSGILERHPNLHAVFVECNGGWIAWAMQTLDYYYQAHSEIGWTKPKLAELPSHYIRHQIHATFQDDPVAVANIAGTGAECLLWGNDYPHPESTYPMSAEVLDRLFERIDTDSARAIVGGNAHRLFGFADTVLESVP
jgi:predicted TIM-barrel fold metal-dependent hydrolase